MPIAALTTAVLAFAIAFSGVFAVGEGPVSAVAPADAPASAGAASAGGSATAERPAEQPDTTDVARAFTTSSPDSALAEYHGAACEAGTLLLGVAAGASAERAAADALAAAEAAGMTGVSIERCSDTMLRATLAGDVALDDAMAVFAGVEAVASSQPNFVYELAEAEGPDGGAGAGGGAAADDAADQPGILAAASADLTLAVQAAATNDPLLEEQWSLESIHAFDAWKLGKSNRHVTVAVVDNLFNVGHEDLVDNVVAPYNAVLRRQGTDMNGATYHGSSPVGHGTHVAGIIAAQADNQAGIAGVSYNANVMPVRIEDDNGTISTEYLVSAYDYILANAAQYNVRVINLSVGAGRANLSWDALDRELFAKIDEAYDRGIITVTAACNSSNSFSAPFYCFPGDYEKCVTVINVSRDLQRAALSNYNRFGQRTKDISAPGTDIISTTMDNSSTPAADAYSSMSGTSMASPCVSGVLALMFAADPGLTAPEAVSKLYSTAQDLNAAENINGSAFDLQTGWGLIDAQAVMQATAVLLEGPTVLSVGGSVRLNPKPAQSGDWSWSSSDPAIASAEGNAAGGLVTGKRAGTAAITATDGKGSRAVQTVTVYDPSISGASVVLLGSSSSLSVSPTPVGVWEWTSSNPSVVRVSTTTGTGCTVTAVGAGTATVTVALADNPEITSSVTITVGASISAAVIGNVGDTVYRGQAVTFPDLTVTLGTAVLVPGRDYSISYSGNDRVGTATVTVVGRGAYLGTKTKAFQIGVGSLDDAEVTGITDMRYSGMALTQPGMSVKLDGSELVNGVDYSVTYLSNVNAGTARIVMTGIGYYVGSCVRTFTIEPASLEGATLHTLGTQTYTGQANDANAYVSLDGRVLSPSVDYTLSYADNVNAGTARVVATGSGNYSGTVMTTFDIEPAGLEGGVVTLPAIGYVYSGSAVQPNPTVTVNGRRLARGADYEVSYSRSVRAGTATLNVTGMGNYDGKLAVDYEIDRASVDGATVTVANQYFTGRALEPIPMVRCGNTMLRRNMDYLVTYSDNTELGTASMRIVGVGNYTGTWEGTFKIVERPMYIAATTIMNVGATHAWTLQHCSLRVTQGESIVSIDGAKVTATQPGTARVAVVDERGVTIATRYITVRPEQAG